MSPGPITAIPWRSPHSTPPRPGLRALSTRIDVIANNLANAETTAFKGSRVNFEDLLYRCSSSRARPTPTTSVAGGHLRRPRHPDQQHAARSRRRAAPKAPTASSMSASRARILQDQDPRTPSANGIGYTRNGNFFVNKDGDLVLGMGDGYKLDPAHPDPHRHHRHQHRHRTAWSAYVKAGSTTKKHGRPTHDVAVRQTRRAEPARREHLHRHRRQRPGHDQAGRGGAGTILQGFLEGSNVDPVKNSSP